MVDDPREPRVGAPFDDSRAATHEARPLAAAVAPSVELLLGERREQQPQSLALPSASGCS